MNIRKTKAYKDVRKLLAACMRYLPLNRNKIIFDNFGGQGFGDDPRYIAEKLHALDPKLSLYWVTYDLDGEFPSWIHPVKCGSVWADYHWLTAKVWVDNIKSTIRPPKRKGQFYIQTWHSTLGFKMNEADAPNLMKRYLDIAMKDSKQIDLMYSNNTFRFEKYKNRFWYDGEVLKCDVPRTGFLLHPSKAVRKKVYEYFHIPENKKLVLYAPTFRAEKNLEIYQFDYIRCQKQLSEAFGGDYEMLIRLHPNDCIYKEQLNLPESVYNATGYPDMQELLMAADVLITDYSGSMFEFGFTRKPVFLFAKDVKAYQEKDRKLYFSLEELPFSLSETEEELWKAIAEFDSASYGEKCLQFEEKIGFEDHGQGASVIAGIILKKRKE